LKHNGESTIEFVDFHAFGHRVGVIFTTDVAKTVKTRLNRTTCADTVAICFPDPHHAKSLLIFNYEANVGTLVHECFHAVWNLFKYHGVKFSDEAVAYHLDYIVKRVHLIQSEARKAMRTYYGKQRAKRKSGKGKPEQQNIGIVRSVLQSQP